MAVANGRISPRSFPRYRIVRGLLRRVLAEVDLFLMQAEPHAERDPRARRAARRASASAAT